LEERARFAAQEPNIFAGTKKSDEVRHLLRAPKATKRNASQYRVVKVRIFGLAPFPAAAGELD
jgi:hypothetical protein